MREWIIQYIREQVNVDVNLYRTEFTQQWENKDEIIIEYRMMPRSDLRKLRLFASKKNAQIRIEEVGVWGLMIGKKII